MLADSDMSPVYTLPLVLYALLLCYLQERHPPRDWGNLVKCQNIIQHSPEGGRYCGVAVNSEGLLAVTNCTNQRIHFLRKEGASVTSIGKGVRGGLLYGMLCGKLGGIAFDLKMNVWVADKLLQDGLLLQTIDHAGSKSDHFINPLSVSVSPEGLICICDIHNHHGTVHDEDGMFLFAYGSKGSGLGCFDGLVYMLLMLGIVEFV